jgi:hypothetical protein
MVTSSENILIDRQLIKTNCRYIPIDKQPTIGSKSCHSIGNNILIFIDHRLVESFDIQDGTQLEQVPTSEGILLRRRIVEEDRQQTTELKY